MKQQEMDVLRETVSAWAVFAGRVRRGWKKAAGGVLFTAVLGGLSWLLALGPEGTGLAWATRERLAAVISVVGVGWLVYMGWILYNFTPSRNDRVIIALRKFVRANIDPLEESVRGLSDDKLRARTGELKKRLAEGASLDSVRAEAYAGVREASRRAREHRQFECQLIGGKVLEDGNVAEMRTGEGKTIVCYMANYMKILAGHKVHLVTVNDYLVKRDAEFCRPIFELLDATVGYISADMETYGEGAEERRAAYECDITYGTNSEFGFDYLRDHMKMSAGDQVQGHLDYTVVDEVDSILIDEARTPLIISGPAHDDVSNYRVADNVARSLIRKQEQANRDMAARIDDLAENPPQDMKGDAKFNDGIKKFRADPLWLNSDEAEAIGHMQYFVVELDRKSAHMTEHGAKAAQAELAIGTFYDSKNMNWPHYIDNALRAHLAYQNDKEYVVQDDTIIIVDEFTGRLMHGRQWSDGLHQAVEAREKVTVKQETQTLATITLQNFFKLYEQLAGMTGTAMTEAEEFMKIYKLEVIAIPTDQAIRRADSNDKIYKTIEGKWDAIVEEIRSYSQNGFPADPWSLYDMLKDSRKELQHALKHGGGDEAKRKLEIIDDALTRFDDGEGDAEAPEEGYRKLMAGKFGGRPVLVGTVSVDSSEKLSQMLTRRFGIEHEVLNAKNHAREAEIVAKAGYQHEEKRGKSKAMYGNVTIATNMAGRGTDIVLGPGVADIGGLHVIGTERHESRRIDNQLRGRCGRQGDLGSSRFFLSLEDDLLRLFMGEWALKMLNSRFIGFDDKTPIEARAISRGIERAQRKVEERNFNIRKNLLEYDEVMDYQRKTFYQMRQRVVEGRRLSDLIWVMIDETVAGAIERYYDPKYSCLCVAEWVGQHLEVAISADRLDTSDFDGLCEQVRSFTSDEARSTIQRTFGEYIDTDTDPEEWDARGFASWAARFGLNLTLNQIRKCDPKELLENIIAAALTKTEEADLAPLQQYVDKTFPKARLVRWARDKFDVQIPIEDLAKASAEDAVGIFGEKMRNAYLAREVEYPPHVAVEFAMQRGGANVNQVCAEIAQWAERKYSVQWDYSHFAEKKPLEIYEELCDLQRAWLRDGKLEAEIDGAIEKHSANGVLKWAFERFGPLVERTGVKEGPTLRDDLLRCGRELLCFELRQLERYILINIYDQIWKDHMYSMDLLRHGIGLRGYAERDPKIEYKREGTRMFNEMQSNIRERVTDLIFKAQIAGGTEDDRRTAYRAMQAGKQDATNAGLASADREAAMQKQGEGGKLDPIRRSVPKVGRNDPCPCGSGKKYKQCHGKTGAKGGGKTDGKAGGKAGDGK